MDLIHDISDQCRSMMKAIRAYYQIFYPPIDRGQNRETTTTLTRALAYNPIISYPVSNNRGNSIGQIRYDQLPFFSKNRLSFPIKGFYDQIISHQMKKIGRASCRERGEDEGRVVEVGRKRSKRRRGLKTQ